MAGVTCDSTKTKVTHITWVPLSLSGSIPSELGNLINLQRLALGSNRLNGTIPPELGNLINLKVFKLEKNQLNGPIPAEIGKMKDLGRLWLNYNKLSGSIPASIGNLINLRDLKIDRNTRLNGTFNPRCGMIIDIASTQVISCGCASTVTPAVLFPPAGTSLACLSTGPATPLAKRIQIFSKTLEISSSLATMMHWAALCNPSYISRNSTRITECKNAVDTITKGLSTLWKNVRKNCGKWSFDGRIGSVTSTNCINANNALKSAFYILPDTSKQYVDDPFIDSVNTGLWAVIA